jgi:glycosyltransferase involved in cell wall biosynthesis
MSTGSTQSATGRTPLRVLVLCHEYLPIGGGAAAVCQALSRHYQAAGFSVHVVTMAYGDLPPEEVVDGIAVHRISCRRKRKDMAAPSEGLRWAWRARKVVRRLHNLQPFDVVHAHFVMPAGIVGHWLKRTNGIPFLVTLHGSDVPGFNQERLQLTHRIVRPWWRRICRSADRIVSPSHDLMELLQSSTGDYRGTIIPNGFDTQRFELGRKQNRILLCSRLVERKGFHTFLKAIQPLQLEDWSVDIVGDGPMRDRLAAIAQQCSVPVRLHGWIDNDSPKLAQLYQQARIFALPSERENCSIALLEAMSAGCAVITTDVSGNPEVVGDCGKLVAPNEVAGLQQALVHLTTDLPHCQLLGQQALKRARNEFDWRVVGTRYVELCQELAGRAAHQRRAA